MGSGFARMSLDIQSARPFNVVRHWTRPDMTRENHPLLWLMTNAKKPLFTQADVLHLAPKALTAVNLQNWANRGFIEPHMSPEKKSRRRYDAVQLVQISTGLPLIQHGFGPLNAFMSINIALMKFMRDLVNTSEGVQPGPDGIPLDQLQSFFAVFPLDAAGEPLIKHERDLAGTLATRSAAVVIPFGRAILDLGERAMNRAEKGGRLRPVAPVGTEARP